MKEINNIKYIPKVNAIKIIKVKVICKDTINVKVALIPKLFLESASLCIRKLFS